MLHHAVQAAAGTNYAMMYLKCLLDKRMSAHLGHPFTAGACGAAFGRSPHPDAACDATGQLAALPMNLAIAIAVD